MDTHNIHHFVPQFLLQHWHTLPDEKLSSFRWAHGALSHKRYKAKSVAKMEGLYALKSNKRKNLIEQDFFAPAVDSPAAVAHATLLQSGVKALNDQQKVDWSRFLVSLMLRGPEQVEAIRQRGRAVLTASLSEAPHEFREIKGDNPAETLLEWVEANAPTVFDDLGIATLPNLVESEVLNNTLLHSTWSTRLLDDATYDLLVSDNPLRYVGSMGKAFLIVLPISPRRVFFAFNQRETWNMISRETDSEIVKRANRETVSQARDYVYATNGTQAPFIERYLPRRAN